MLQLAALERVVGSAAQQVDQRLMEVLYSKYHLERHCDAIRRYLLLGQGDFVVALMDALGTELYKPANEVSEVVMNHLLRQAVLSSAARYDDEDTLERLRARKEAAAGTGGADPLCCVHAVIGCRHQLFLQLRSKRPGSFQWYASLLVCL